MPLASEPALIEFSAAAAVAAMRAGDIKAEDYARTLLDRARQREDLNAFRALNREMVLESARNADKSRASGAPLGMLHGLPIAVKDSINTAALPTSNGTRALRNFRPRDDAAVLKPLFAQGAILMGKTNLHELSFGWTSNNTAFGAIGNPYSPAHVPGGSSGGSAAAVAARMAPLAVGEDTLGSIRIPASSCGLVGLRPTLGRYPNGGVMSLTAAKFDQVGPLARTVEDLALFDTAVTGDRSPVNATPSDQIRIGVSPFLMSGLDPEVERVSSAALRRLGDAGVTLVEVELPEAKAAMMIAFTVISYEVVSSISDYLDSERTGMSFDQMLGQASEGMRATIGAAPCRPPGHPQTYSDRCWRRATNSSMRCAAYSPTMTSTRWRFPRR